MIEFVSGLYKSPYDERDILMESFLEPAITLPESFSLRDKMGPVRSQGKEGSCAGHAGSMVKEYQEQINHKKFIRLSPRFIYELAKQKSGNKEGTTLKAIVEVMKEYGICEERLCPYVAREPCEITEEAYKNAKNYKIITYGRIKGIQELKQTVYQQYPRGGATIIGIYLFKGVKSEQSKETGAIPDPSCFDRFKPLGGHAVTATGWQNSSPFYKNDGHIEAEGSWDKSFGDEGYHFISYAYIKRHMIDAMAVVDIKTPVTLRRVGDLSISERKEAWI